MMQLDVRKNGDVLVLALDGRLVAGVGDAVLREAMNQIVADGWRKILLDMSNVPRIDSAGIGELTDSHRLAERFGCEMRLLNVHGQVRRVLEMSRLLPLFRVHHDERDAVDAFGATPVESKTFDA